MLLMMTFSLITLTSCSSDDDGGAPGGAPAGVLVAKVDGVTFQSLEISSSATVVNAGPAGTNLIVIATNSDGNAFAFTIIGYTGEGTYELGGDVLILHTASYTETDVDLNNPLNSTTEIWQAPYDDTMVGEINISQETDTNVVGTFQFTAKNVNGDQSVKTITEGSFDLEKMTN